VTVSDAPNSVKTHFSHEASFTIVIFLIIQTTELRLFSFCLPYWFFSGKLVYSCNKCSILTNDNV